MPIYLYEILGEGGNAGKTFECMQKLCDAALESHPETGEPVRRIVAAPSLPLKYGESRQRDLMTDKNVAEKGFTRYEKAGDGVYQKTAGKGPDTIYR